MTASGRIITISAKAIPTARARRKVIRAGALILYGLIIGGIGIACIVAVYMMVQPPPDQSAGMSSRISEARGGFDPDANPFKSAVPNVLGLPLGGRAAAVVDAGSDAATWLSVVADAVLVGQRRAGPNDALQVVLWTEGGALAIPDEPKVLAPADRAALRDFFNGLSPAGSTSPVPALEKALLGKPGQVVLVTSQRLAPEDIAAVRAVLKGGPPVRLDVVLISTESAELKSLAAERGGRYLSLPQSRLISWYRQAQPEIGAAMDELSNVMPAKLAPSIYVPSAPVPQTQAATDAMQSTTRPVGR